MANLPLKGSYLCRCKTEHPDLEYCWRDVSNPNELLVPYCGQVIVKLLPILDEEDVPNVNVVPPDADYVDPPKEHSRPLKPLVSSEGAFPRGPPLDESAAAPAAATAPRSSFFASARAALDAVQRKI